MNENYEPAFLPESPVRFFLLRCVCLYYFLSVSVFKFQHPKNGPDVDLLNDETFGSGAVGGLHFQSYMLPYAVCTCAGGGVSGD